MTEVTVVVPTRNEADNVACLVERTSLALSSLKLDWEMLFVDDSDDATPTRVLEAKGSGYPVRLLHRPPGRRAGGLGGAVVAGLALTDARVLAVIDGDLQHRPEVLVELVDVIRRGEADVVIASRRTGCDHGGAGLGGWWRDAVSTAARSVVHLLFPGLRRVVDPLAGFFALDRAVVEDLHLRPEGYKILLEVLVRGNWRTISQVPHELEPRLHGQSKARLRQGLAFGHHLARLMGRPTRHRPDPAPLVLPAANPCATPPAAVLTRPTGRRAQGTSR